MVNKNDPPWNRDPRFIIPSLIGLMAAIAAIIALFQSHEVRVQLDSWNDTRLKTQVERDIADFGRYLIAVEKGTRDSVQATSSRLSVGRMGQSSTFKNVVEEIANDVCDSIDDRWVVLNRNLQDYLIQSGFRDTAISGVEFLRGEADSLTAMASAKENVKSRIRDGVEALKRSRGLH